jgi:hypothetical protein
MSTFTDKYNSIINDLPPLPKLELPSPWMHPMFFKNNYKRRYLTDGKDKVNISSQMSLIKI